MNVLSEIKTMATKATAKIVNDVSAIGAVGNGQESDRHDKDEDHKTRIHRGDYRVQVHIIEARDLQPKDSGNSCDPVCTVTVSFGAKSMKKTTKIFKKCFSCMFDSIFIFDFPDLTPSEIEIGAVDICVKDANRIMRDTEIGSCSYEISEVYFQPNHELHRVYATLSSDSEGIQGYLKSTLVVLGPDDELFIHNDDSDDSDEGTVMVAPHIQREGKQLCIELYACEDMPIMDDDVITGDFMKGGCDPFLEVSFAGKSIANTSKTSSLSVVFNDTLKLPVYEPVMSRNVRMTFFDYDLCGNDRIGTFNIDYHELKDKKSLPPRWYNMYGAPEGKQNGKRAKKMNRGILPGTYYRGRALLSMSLESCTHPVREVITRKNDYIWPKNKNTTYQIQMDLYEAIDTLSVKGGKISVQISCGRNNTTSSIVELNKGRAMWYEMIPSLDITIPTDLSMAPDIFIYVIQGKTRFCFIRLNAQELVSKGWDVAPSWIHLQEDRTMKYIPKGASSGSILCSVRMGTLESVPKTISSITRPLVLHNNMEEKKQEHDNNDNDIDDIDDIDMKEEDFKTVSNVGNLTIKVINGRNLPIGDSNGLSDPYIQLRLGGIKHKTNIKMKTLNPDWNEENDKNIFIWDTVATESIITIKVFDYDKYSVDDELGRFNIHLLSILYPKDENRELGQSFHNYERTFMIGEGTITLSFSFEYHANDEESIALFEQAKKKMTAHRKNKQLQSMFSLKSKKSDNLASMSSIGSKLGSFIWYNFQLRFHLFQARNLISSDDNGLADPYVIVKCFDTTLKFPTKRCTLYPMWYTTLVANVSIPTPMQFAAPIRVFVMDYDTVGGDDLLGTCSIPVSDAVTSDPSILEPMWYKLYDLSQKSLSNSQLLACVQLLNVNESQSLPKELPSLIPSCKNMILEIATLGLRDLQSLFGIHKTYIEFDLGDRNTYRTKKSKLPLASSPNFLQILRIPIKVPIDDIFSLHLNLNIHDEAFGGLVKRMIGSGMLCLNKFILEEDTENKNEWNILKISGKAIMKEKQNEKSQKQQQKKLDDEWRIDMTQSDDFKQPLLQFDSLNNNDSTVSHMKSINSSLRNNMESKNYDDDSDDSDDSDDFLMNDNNNNNRNNNINDVVHLEMVDNRDHSFLSKLSGKAKKSMKNLESKYDNNEDELLSYMKNRSIIDDELEDKMNLSPFRNIPLYYGQHESRRQIGTYKGIIRLCDEKQSIQSPLYVNELLKTKQLYLRIYILKGLSLTPKDANGKSDPYLTVTVGNETKSTRNRYIPNTINPCFYESFEFGVTIPGTSSCCIKVFDWDGLGDDFIGQTSIDIEDRWFTKEWRMMDIKPLERRTLRSLDSYKSQGKLEVWVDILTPEQAKYQPLLDISPPKPMDYELRVIVYDVENVPFQDEFTEQSDLFVVGYCDSGNNDKTDKNMTCRQETDIHMRSKDGSGHFNYRMKWPLTLGLHSTRVWPRLRLQIWDFDILAANDAVCEITLSLKELCKLAIKKQQRIAMTKNDKEIFYLDNLHHPKFPKQKEGKMKLSIQILPKTLCDSLPAGMGRNEPNQNPYLSPPRGRIDWNLFHPMTLIFEILGPNGMKKITCAVCLMLFIGSMYAFLPTLLSVWTGDLFNPFN